MNSNLNSLKVARIVNCRPCVIRSKVALIGKFNSQTNMESASGARQHPLRALVSTRNSKLTTNNSDFARTRCYGGGEV